jgi:outer membrane protein assembly factor BamB
MKTLALALLVASTAVAVDWPHYRGPAQDGSTSETVAPFPGTGPRELWRVQVGTGLSSVTVAGDSVFTAGYDKGREVLHCLNAKTGKTEWTHAWPAKLGDYLFEGGPRATPTVDGKHVYMLGADGHVVCVAAATGKPVWQRDLVKEFGGTRMDWGFSSSPTIDGDKVLLDSGGSGASTIALSRKDGSVIWKAGDDQPGYASVHVAPIDGRKTAVVFKAGTLVGHDAQSGKVLWSFPWETSFKVNAATPLLVGDLLVISSAYNHGAAAVRVKDGKPEQVWFTKKLKAHFNSPVHKDGFLYGIDGEVGRRSALVCLDAKTGDEKWRTSDGKVKNGSLLLIGDGKLLILSEGGDLILAEANSAAYREISRAKVLRDRCWVQPVLANGTIYCRNNVGELVALSATGK